MKESQLYRLGHALGLYTALDQQVFHMLPSRYTRAAYVKANFLLFRKLRMAWPVEVQTRYHFRMIVDKVDRVAGYIYYFRVWEPQISALIAQLLEPGDTVLDVGAHIGHHTLLAAKAVGDSGRVYSFEASPRTFEALKANISLNQLANVDAKNLAVCAQTGSVNLFLASHENSGRNSLAGRDGWQSIAVPCTRLDALLDEIPVSTVKLIKIDVEGAEPEVLAGASELLARLPRDVAILVELQMRPTDCDLDGSEILDCLVQQGFKAYIINNDYSAVSYDAPVALRPAADLQHNVMADVLFVRGRLVDQVARFLRSSGSVATKSPV